MSDEQEQRDDDREPKPGEAEAEDQDPESGPASDPPPGHEPGEGKIHDL